MSRRTRAAWILATAGAVALAPLAAGAAEKKGGAKAAKDAAPDSTMKIEAGSEGRDFDSITVEGEDRVRVRFERPGLRIDLDPQSAPGLDWESVWAVLDAESFDFVGPLVARPALERSPYAPRPWLDTFRSGPVARFRPEVKDVESWTLEVADSRGRTVSRFDGSGKPPKEIAWDGTTSDGTPARTDLTYSYVLNAKDRAGNARAFVGDGFRIPPYVTTGSGGPGLSFPVPLEGDDERVPQHLVLEAATRLNQSLDASVPVRVEVTAPTFAQAKAIGDGIASALRPHLPGGASRISVGTLVDAGGGEFAAVTIRAGSAGPK